MFDTPRAHRDEFLPFSPPDITEAEIEEVVDSLRSGWITTGPKVKRFEGEFADFVHAPAALALNSCTAGLHLALATMDIAPGDEVITTPMTFAASVNVIEHVGATPILADVDAETLNIDPARIAEKVTARTKAIMPVHYTGHPADMTPIVEMAEQHNLTIIEDAAHALPAQYKGQIVGSIGHFTSFSFYATKNLTTAEGGMLTATQPDLLEKARMLSLHGMNRDAWKRYSSTGSWFYEVLAPGFKYNMTDLQAAIGLVQLKRLAEMQARRYQIVNAYNEAFHQLEALQTPVEHAEVEHAWHLYVLRLNLEQLTIDRAQFIDALRERNIGTSVHFIPIHLHPYYRNKYGWQPHDFPIAHREYQRLLSLPLNSTLSNSDVEDVIAAVKDVVEQHSV